MTETSWDLDYVANLDDACSIPFMTVNIVGDYSLEDNSDVAEGARNGTFGFTTKTVTAHNADAAGFVMQACGFDTVEENTPVDIAEGCAGLGAYPISDCPADYDIVMISEEGNLHFGARPADNDMCTPEKRPTTFEGGAVVTKQ